MEGFNRPAFIASVPIGMNASAKQAREWWGPIDINAKPVELTIISQPALDPQSPIHDAKYLAELLSVFKQARAAGFVIIPTMDWQAENGVPDLPGMPNDSTIRAWQTLAPTLINDRGVIFELFNEPKRANWDEARKEWAKDMQAVVDALRAMGSKNILLLDGLGYAQWTNDLFPLVHDSIPNRMAMAVHPYMDPMSHEKDLNPEEYWHKHFGLSAEQYPLIATEWNATPTNGCVDSRTPALAMRLMKYLESLHIGLIGWAIDSNAGKMVKDHTSYEPTDYASFKDCNDGSISGGGKLLANYPND